MTPQVAFSVCLRLTPSNLWLLRFLFFLFFFVFGFQILFDGVSLRALDPKAVLARMAVVLQELDLFDLTVAQNVSFVLFGTPEEKALILFLLCSMCFTQVRPRRRPSFCRRCGRGPSPGERR